MSQTPLSSIIGRCPPGDFLSRYSLTPMQPQSVDPALPSSSRENLGAPERYLAQADECLAGLVERFGVCPLGRERRAPFDALVVAILGQQLSAKAAQSIVARVQARTAASRPFRPDDFLPHTPEWIRESGLSMAKARWILNLARVTQSGELDLDRLCEQSDGDVIARLVDLPGIGPWTAEMFLMFSLGREDVWSLKDAGLRRAVRLLYDVPSLDDEAFCQRAEQWRPYRSAASWYLWQYLDKP